jgi:hypothetical protein
LIGDCGVGAPTFSVLPSGAADSNATAPRVLGEAGLWELLEHAAASASAQTIEPSQNLRLLTVSPPKNHSPGTN